MKKTARTTIGKNLSSTGFELSADALANIVGGSYKLPSQCPGEAPYEVATDTLNQHGGSDTQTDCTSRKP